MDLFCGNGSGVPGSTTTIAAIQPSGGRKRQRKSVFHTSQTHGTARNATHARKGLIGCWCNLFPSIIRKIVDGKSGLSDIEAVNLKLNFRFPGCWSLKSGRDSHLPFQTSTARSLFSLQPNPRGWGGFYVFFTPISLGRVERAGQQGLNCLIETYRVAEQFTAGESLQSAAFMTAVPATNYPSPERSYYPELSWVGGSHPAGIPECMPIYGSPQSHWIWGVTLQSLAGSRPERRNCLPFRPVPVLANQIQTLQFGQWNPERKGNDKPIAVWEGEARVSTRRSRCTFRRNRTLAAGRIPFSGIGVTDSIPSFGSEVLVRLQDPAPFPAPGPVAQLEVAAFNGQSVGSSPTSAKDRNPFSIQSPPPFHHHQLPPPGPLESNPPVTERGASWAKASLPDRIETRRRKARSQTNIRPTNPTDLGRPEGEGLQRGVTLPALTADNVALYPLPDQGSTTRVKTLSLSGGSDHLSRGNPRD